jgi:hypothetical protein
MNSDTAEYRIKITQIDTESQGIYGWEIYRRSDVLPTLRSQRAFGSRLAALADGNRSRLQWAKEAAATGARTSVT